MYLSTETVSLLLGLVVFIGIYHLFRREKKDGKRNTIPGPKLVNRQKGHTLDMQAEGNMSQYLRKIHKMYGPVVGFYMGPTYTVSLGSPSAFNQSRKLFDRPKFLDEITTPLFGERSIQNTSGEEARIRHASYTRFLSFGAISPYYPILQKKCIDVCKLWASKQGSFPVIEVLRKYAIVAVEIVAFRGYVPDDKEVLELTDTYEECWEELESWLKGDMMESGSEREKLFKNNLAIIDSKVRGAYQKSMKQETPDEITFPSLASGLGLDEKTISDDLITFVVGGFHNSSYLMEWGIFFLAKYPSIQEKMHSEIECVLGEEPITSDAVKHLTYVRQFLDELHRWVTIGQIAARNVTEDLEICGYVIPANTPLIHALETIHFDESIYEDPNKFDPERFSLENRKKLPAHSFEPFGFSGGRRCVGSQVFTSEATILFTTVVQKLQLSLPPDLDIKKKIGSFSRPNRNVCIEVIER